MSPVGLLASLRRIIKAGESSENPTPVNAARLAMVYGSRLPLSGGLLPARLGLAAPR